MNSKGESTAGESGKDAQICVKGCADSPNATVRKQMTSDGVNSNMLITACIIKKEEKSYNCNNEFLKREFPSKK